MYFNKSKSNFVKHMFYFGKSTFDALGNSYSSQSIVYLTNVPKYKLIDFDRSSKTAITIHFKYLFYILPPVILLVLSFSPSGCVLLYFIPVRSVGINIFSKDATHFSQVLSST